MSLVSATMRLVILDDYDLASDWAARYIRNRIVEFRPSADRYFTLGLPTGESRRRPPRFWAGPGGPEPSLGRSGSLSRSRSLGRYRCTGTVPDPRVSAPQAAPRTAATSGSSSTTGPGTCPSST